MTEDEAQEIAERRMSELSGLHQFRLATNSNRPLKFPIGWRFPYNLFLEGDRLAGSCIVLFVNKKDGQPETEWSNIVSFDNGEHLDHTLPDLKNVQDSLFLDYPEMQVETHEKIWVVEKNKRQRAWRLGLTKAGRYRYSTWVGNDSEGNIEYIKKPELKSKVIMGKRGTSQNRYPTQSEELTDKLLPLSDDKNYQQSQQSIQNWVAHTIDYLTHLGYGRVNYDDEIHIRLSRVACANDCAYHSPLDNKAEIIFMDIKEGWAIDPTIVCHELGHVVWHLLFAPKLDSGIEEGFADYFAATLVAADKTLHEVEIGGGLPKGTKKRFKKNEQKKSILPRLIDGEPYNFSDDSDSPGDEYRVGRKWANVLWDVRGRIGPEKADAIIFLAHFKPCTDENMPKEPMVVYFQSLIKAAFYLGINFEDWRQLAAKHVPEISEEKIRACL